MPIIITILSIVIIKILLFSFYKNKSWYKNFSKLLQDVGVLISIAAIIYSYMQTDVSIQYAKLAIDQADESSKQSDEVARKTISLLDSISRSSAGLKGNIDSISITIKLMDKYLTTLSQNISNINTFSDEQVKNLKAINTAIQTSTRLLTEQNEKLERESARRPVLKLVSDCKSRMYDGREEVDVFIINLGDIKVKIIECYVYTHDTRFPVGKFALDEKDKKSIGFLPKIILNKEHDSFINVHLEIESDNGFKDIIELNNINCE